ncbi:MAG: GNAT family N-acetyltransferase, partial [Candidatus Omnitrophica bacterium]|nr:GNAT family N-acetyltransferase [Candidatus Omnitrophota bacterium]
MNQVHIRQYQPSDRAAVRRINYETAFLGYAPKLFDSPELVADGLTLYFTDWEPESCFVIEDQGRVVGYVMGTKDVRKMECLMRWW